jgi:lysophospholipase L1-like esterase
MPAGGRLEITTDATAIELDLQLTLLQMDDDPIIPAVFDVEVDGEIVQTVSTTDGTVIQMISATGGFDIRSGGPTTVRFDLPAGGKLVRIWLPNTAAPRLLALRADGVVRPAQTLGARRWIHYGSSISHCLEVEQPTGAWPVVAARLAGVDLQSLAFAGQAQLDPFVARTIASLPADLISLKIGINLVNADSMRERTFGPALHGFLDLIRDAHPDVPLILCTPIWCGAHEAGFGPTMRGDDGFVYSPRRAGELAVGSLTLGRIREIETAIVSKRQAAGDTNLHLFSGLELFGEADAGDLPDGLHPNPAGYRRMGERFHQLAFQDGPFA